jgi:hypothetical protein
MTLVTTNETGIDPLLDRTISRLDTTVTRVESLEAEMSQLRFGGSFSGYNFGEMGDFQHSPRAFPC